MFDKSELSHFQADVVISPVVSQMLGAYTLVAGGCVSCVDFGREMLRSVALRGYRRLALVRKVLLSSL